MKVITGLAYACISTYISAGISYAYTASSDSWLTEDDYNYVLDSGNNPIKEYNNYNEDNMLTQDHYDYVLDENGEPMDDLQ